MTLPIGFQNAGVPADVASLARSLSQLSAGGEGANSLDGRELLRMDKGDGGWHYGIDGIEIGKGDTIAINPASFKHGFISWGDSEVLGEMMVAINEPVPQRSTLQDTGEKWDEQLQFEAQVANGDDAGTMLVYKSTAHGGKEAIRTLARQIVAKSQQDPNFIVPIIELSNTSYKHKKYGKIFKPVFTAVDWVDFDGNSKGEPKKLAAQSNAPDPAPKADDKRDLIEEALEEPTEAPPTNTRRRRRR